MGRKEYVQSPMATALFIKKQKTHKKHREK